MIMPFLDPRFVQIPPLQDYFVDKDTGFPLSAGIVTFYKDNDHTVLKPVYQLSAGPNNTYIYNELPDPLQLSSVGTFIDENGSDIVPYFFPYDGTPVQGGSNGVIDLYYITVYSSAGVFQFSRDSWPNIAPGSLIGDNIAITDNQLSNPQFSEVTFNPLTPAPGYTFAVSGTGTVHNIAPDWDIITTGTGTVTVQQIASIDIALPSNAPFLLDINSTSSGGGLTLLQLRQRLYQDPRLFAGGFANGSFVAGSKDGNPHQLIMDYVPSSVTATSYQLINQNITGTFLQYTGTKEIDGVLNPDSPLTGYVDIVITIPVSAHIQITSLQLVAVPSVNATVGFIEQTTQREADHLFHYYQHELIIKPKDTILTGWDFPMNPWQFTDPTSHIITNKCQYITDQTILYSQTASALYAGQANIAFRQCLSMTANNAGSASNQFALIQFIDPTICRPYWSYIVSALVRCRLFSALNPAEQVGIKMRLIFATSLPLVIGNTEPIVSLSGSTITFAAGWNVLAPLNDPTYILPNASTTFETPNGAGFPEFSFDGFELPNCTTTTQTLGVVIYTTAPISNIGSSSAIAFDSISLVPNRFAVQTNPKTTDQVLQECEFYYEKSYDSGTLPGTATIVGQQTYQQNYTLSGAVLSMYPGIFNIDLRTAKRAIPGAGNIAIYTPATPATLGVQAITYINGSVLAFGDISLSNYLIGSSSTKYLVYTGIGVTPLIANATASTVNPYSLIAFHYVVDVRLGTY
jgi:hypothetical protein